MDFKLPEIGEGVHEGELIKWLVKDGDTVSADQPLLEVMTDKATVEVPAPSAGVIRGIKAKEGEMIKVGSTLATIEAGAQASAQAAGGGAKAATAQNQSAASEPAAAKNPAPAQSGEGANSPEETRQQTRGAGQPTPAAAPAYGNPPQSAHQNGNGQSNGGGAYQGALEQHAPTSVPAAPIVRAMAQKSGVDLGTVPATGPEGRVLERDLVNFLQQQQQAPVAQASYAPPAAPTAGAKAPKTAATLPLPQRQIGTNNQGATERVPVRGLRRVIAQAMVRSKYTAPHYSYVDEFECSQLVAIREQSKKIGEKYGVKVTYLPFVVKAVVAALKEFPVVNSSLEETDKGMELVYKKFFNIGFAVATNDGLVVPVIKNADQKTLLEIAHEMAELSAKVRAGKAAADDLKGSTFSITSMGNIGGLFATPIINYPEVGILGVYKVQEKPIVQEGQIVVGKTMHLSLSLDHRVVDGAVGGYFCNAIIERLQNPARLLMDMV